MMGKNIGGFGVGTVPKICSAFAEPVDFDHLMPVSAEPTMREISRGTVL